MGVQEKCNGGYSGVGGGKTGCFVIIGSDNGNNPVRLLFLLCTVFFSESFSCAFQIHSNHTFLKPDNYKVEK